jgi:hypothetical protein
MKTGREFEDWMESINYTEWMEWANKPNENRSGRNNVLPEIVEYLSDHPEEFNESAQSIEDCAYIMSPSASPRTWLGVSETIIDQFFENRFGERYNSVVDIPQRDLICLISGIIGSEAAERFTNYILQKHPLKPTE